MNRIPRILLLLLTAALPLALSNCAGVTAAAATKPDPGGQGNGCSNATLQGQYAFRVSPRTVGQRRARAHRRRQNLPDDGGRR